LEYQAFSTDLTQLGIGIKTQTDNYKYSSEIKGNSATIAGVISHKADAIKPALKAYLGIVGTTIGNTQTNEALTVAFACEANLPGTAVVTAATGVTNCPTGYKSLGG
jgi:type IV pilus assembly protein PilA